VAADKESLHNLHDALADDLADRIKNGETVVNPETGEVKKVKTPAAVLNVALGLLKHNKIECRPVKGNPLGNLVSSLPFAGQEAVDEDGKPITLN
jgi:hypothetical protein